MRGVPPAQPLQAPSSTSEAAHASAPAPTPPTASGPDPVRLGVRRTLRDLLNSRFVVFASVLYADYPEENYVDRYLDCNLDSYLDVLYVIHSGETALLHLLICIMFMLHPHEL